MPAQARSLPLGTAGQSVIDEVGPDRTGEQNGAAVDPEPIKRVDGPEKRGKAHERDVLRNDLLLGPRHGKCGRVANRRGKRVPASKVRAMNLCTYRACGSLPSVLMMPLSL